MIENLIAANNAFQAGAIYLTEYERVLSFKLRRPKREKFLLEAIRVKFAEARSALNHYEIQVAMRKGLVTIHGNIINGREVHDDEGHRVVSWGI